MLAVTCVSQSDTDPLSGLEVGERPDPQVPDGWTTVQLRTAALNHHDVWSLRGVGLPADRLPMVLGCDGAGVDADGNEVLVLAVPRHNVVPKPEGLSWEHAACLPTAWLTAYRMLFTNAEVQPGGTVLVQGAAGGVATALVQLGTAAGIRMWVTSRDAAKGEHAVALGADRAFESGARLPERVDAVMETVGAATWSHSVNSLRPGGTVVISGATSGDAPAKAELTKIFFKQLRVVGSTMGTRDELSRLARFVVDAGIEPQVDSVRPLTEARHGFERMVQGAVAGKVVFSL